MASNPTLSQIKVGNVVYDICDTTARNSITSLDNSVSSLDNSISSLNNSVSSLNNRLNTIVSVSSDATDVGTGTYHRKHAITLTPGTYLILVGCFFASNSSGYRQLYLTTSSNQGTNRPNGGRFAENVVHPATSKETWLYLSNLLNLSSTTTYYVVVYQNSGSTLSCSSTYKYIKLA